MLLVECSCEEDNVTEEVDSAAGNWGIAEEETESKVCSELQLIICCCAIWQRYGYGTVSVFPLVAVPEYGVLCYKKKCPLQLLNMLTGHVELGKVVGLIICLCINEGHCQTFCRRIEIHP